MEVETGGAVSCIFCTKRNSVKHILTECEVLDNVRNVIFKKNVTLKQLLTSSNLENALLLFLNETSLVELI